MNRFLLEVSFEVANKVGGIYTVLKEKAPYIKEKFGDNYLVIGPFNRSKGFQDFTSFAPPEDFEQVIVEAERYGLKVYYGEWLIEGRPKGFLIDGEELLPKLDAFKYELWEQYKIDSRRVGADYSEPLLWAKAVSLFLKSFCNYFSGKKIVIHFHEWLAGAASLFEQYKAVTIFTTHATVLGRALASAGVNFWEKLNQLSPEEEAYRLGVEAKHQLEKQSARQATYFTVVSDLLKLEAEKFLGRKVEFILPNGLDFKRFPTIEEIATAHRKNREVLREFIMFFFAPYYKVETRDSLILFISGRSEIKNKGFDIFIKALNKLNNSLSAQDKNIFVFIWAPGNVTGVDQALVSNLNIYRGIEEKIDEMGAELKSRLLHYLIHQQPIAAGNLFTPEEFLQFKRMFSQVKKDSLIPIATHLPQTNDPIANLLHQANLLNHQDDKVKVIYYPIYVSSTDGLLNLNYEDAVSGCHIGVFPSFYEPWGYTPLETAASGVLTITTDLTGFADYIKKQTQFDTASAGITILARQGATDETAVNKLTETLSRLIRLQRTERVAKKLEARQLAAICDWQKLIENYYNLYEQAFNQ